MSEFFGSQKKIIIGCIRAVSILFVFFINFDQSTEVKRHSVIICPKATVASFSVIKDQSYLTATEKKGQAGLKLRVKCT